MGKKDLTLEQKKLDTDIWIIALITMGMFLFYMMFGNQMMDYIKNSSNSIILRLALNGGFNLVSLD
ncbi:hypothetical protein H477_2406 [[Clostridium] sordellii ATCC 9714]|nr:hypothetical protein H477_2406 [[Clostridium] sordellii ATCC 9714] [Paeniclostridium sordellii ATCC 9714]